MKKILNIVLFAAVLGAMAIVYTGCKSYLPTDRKAFDKNADFTQKVFMPVLGRNTIYKNSFSPGNSSLPMTFKIINPRQRNGTPAPIFFKTFPTLVWKKAYTGKETSLKQIIAERAWEPHPMFQIRKHSGELMMWATSSSAYFHCQPDSGYLFDVVASNSGGRRIYRNLKLIPYRARPYEPNNVNAITGANLDPAVHPSSMRNVKGSKDDALMSPNDVNIYFHKTGNPPVLKNGRKTYTGSLTFMFLDSSLHPINPKKFNLTDWKHLVHGFDMTMTDSTVRYNVAYPIPLIDMRTRYTTPSGNQASVDFSYKRQGFGDKREVADIKFNFNIYEPGDWEIIFWFSKETPKFKND